MKKSILARNIQCIYVLDRNRLLQRWLNCVSFLTVFSLYYFQKLSNKLQNTCFLISLSYMLRVNIKFFLSPRQLLSTWAHCCCAYFFFAMAMLLTWLCFINMWFVGHCNPQFPEIRFRYYHPCPFIDYVHLKHLQCRNCQRQFFYNICQLIFVLRLFTIKCYFKLPLFQNYLRITLGTTE